MASNKFLARPDGNQAFTAAQFTVDFEDEQLDTDGQYDDVNSSYQTPAEVDGGWGIVWGSVKFSANENITLYIQRDAQDDTFFNTAVQSVSDSVDGGCISSGPLRLIEDRKYRMSADGDSTGTVEDDPRSFFGGYFSSDNRGFRVENPSSELLVQNVAETIDWGTGGVDPDNVHSGEEFIVPAGWDGEHGVVMAGAQFSAAISGQVQLQRSVNDGVDWSLFCSNFDDNGIGSVVSSGRIIFNEDDRWRVRMLNESSNANLQAFPGSFFGAMVLN